MEMYRFTARVHDLVSAIIPITAKISIDLFELPRVDDPQLIMQGIAVGFEGVHGEASVIGSLAWRQIGSVDPRQGIREHSAWRDRSMFDGQRRDLGTPVLVLDPARVRARVNVMGAGMIEVRPDIVLEEARPWGSLQGVPE